MKTTKPRIKEELKAKTLGISLTSEHYKFLMWVKGEHGIAQTVREALNAHPLHKQFLREKKSGNKI